MRFVRVNHSKSIGWWSIVVCAADWTDMPCQWVIPRRGSKLFDQLKIPSQKGSARIQYAKQFSDGTRTVCFGVVIRFARRTRFAFVRGSGSRITRVYIVARKHFSWVSHVIPLYSQLRGYSSRGIRIEFNLLAARTWLVGIRARDLIRKYSKPSPNIIWNTRSSGKCAPTIIIRRVEIESTHGASGHLLICDALSWFSIK